MKHKSLLALTWLFVVTSTFAGTFTTTDTSIPVAETATATLAGDTAPAAGTATIHLDGRVYIPDGATTP
jgi:hypothetical protein